MIILFIMIIVIYCIIYIFRKIDDVGFIPVLSHKWILECLNEWKLAEQYPYLLIKPKQHLNISDPLELLKTPQSNQKNIINESNRNEEDVDSLSQSFSNLVPENNNENILNLDISSITPYFSQSQKENNIINSITYPYKSNNYTKEEIKEDDISGYSSFITPDEHKENDDNNDDKEDEIIQLSIPSPNRVERKITYSSSTDEDKKSSSKENVIKHSCENDVIFDIPSILLSTPLSPKSNKDEIKNTPEKELSRKRKSKTNSSIKKKKKITSSVRKNKSDVRILFSNSGCGIFKSSAIEIGLTVLETKHEYNNNIY